ncbi:MAG: AMP-binding protein [Hyphomicrobiales bacterium]|nr:AMP-binding protein [Hyphomicrobiales bacterium]
MQPNSVFDLFAAAAGRNPDGPFLCVLPETAAAYGLEAGEIGYAEALARTRALSDAYARAGFGAGHRVGLLLENRPAFLYHWFALNRIGVSVVPINPDLRAAEIEYMIGHSEMVAAVAIASRRRDLETAAAAAGRAVQIIDPDGAPELLATPFQFVEPDADTECALLYTSGTTGRPKGCVLANEYFFVCGDWYANVGGLISLRENCERMITPLPLFHMNAMACSAMGMLRVAGCLTVVDRFHPKSWWNSVRKSRATVLHYLGVMPAMLMAAPPDPSDRMENVRFGFGAGVDRTLHAPFEQRYGFPLIEAWAMTETGSGAVISAHREPRHVGTNCFGRATPDVETRVALDDGSEAPVDTPGELLVRRSGAAPRYGFFREYLKDPEATAEAWAGGWFHTGDVVRRAADGSFHFVDRKKNVIRRSGENISAVEVESVLQQHPAIRQVAVVATPDAVRGDEVLALVTAHDEKLDEPATAQDIARFCLSRLAYYKAPGWIGFVRGIPLTGTQKIQRGALKELAQEKMDAGACHDLRALKKRTA